MTHLTMSEILRTHTNALQTHYTLSWRGVCVNDHIFVDVFLSGLNVNCARIRETSHLNSIFVVVSKCAYVFNSNFERSKK